jgi:hypothetical protein
VLNGGGRVKSPSARRNRAPGCNAVSSGCGESGVSVTVLPFHLQPIADATEDRNRVGALFRSDHRVVGEPVQCPVRKLSSVDGYDVNVIRFSGPNSNDRSELYA